MNLLASSFSLALALRSQTNSGKTHTMTGSPAEAGVIRLAVRDIFHRIRSQSTNAVAANATPTNDNNSGTREYLVRVSYLEIYNEQIYDLLAQPSPSPSKFKSSLQHHHLPPSTSVRIFESRTEGVVVRGLREEIVTCPEDVFALLDAGDARRRVGSTGMNRTSSRSHSVFRLVLESRASSSKGGGGGPGAVGGGGGGGIPSLAPSSNSSVNSDSDSVASGTQHSQGGASVRGPVRISSLSLVDLAGSESVKSTGSTGVRQKEGQYINKSLLTLGHVVHKLSEMSSREKGGGGSSSSSSSSSLSMMAPNEHIPYRDSKLTRLLQPSLGGNAQVCIICNVSPALSNLEESHNTLKFAMRAKKIRQHARVTEVMDEKTLLRSYREEIEELKRQLREARRTSADAQHSQQRHRRQGGREDQAPSAAVEYPSSSDEEDHDDTHVLVSAIANLESLILKAGAKSSRKATTVRSNSSIATTSDEGNDESSLPSRALDAALMRVESVVAPHAKSESSSPAIASNSDTASKSVMTPAAAQRVEDGDEDHHHLLEELHRIQEMLGVVMKRKRKGGGGGAKLTTGSGSGKNVNNPEGTTPERDAEVELLRMQLQEQEVATTMRKADSSFLQGQLNVKDG
jgi:centromeric protein E